MDEEHKEKKNFTGKSLRQISYRSFKCAISQKKTYLESAETDGVRSIALLHIDAPKAMTSLSRFFTSFFRC